MRTNTRQSITGALMTKLYKLLFLSAMGYILEIVAVEAAAADAAAVDAAAVEIAEVGSVAQAEPIAAAPGETLEVVIVQAQRRQTRLLDTPLAVNVLDSGFISDYRLARLEVVAKTTPGFSGWEQGVSTPIFAIRGISSNSFGIGGEASVGVFVNETYRGRINSTAITLVDVEQIEILKGPQGTLFGRNSSAGAILIRNFAPSADTTLEAQVEAGENDYLGGQFTGNVPLASNWALRGSAFAYNDDGDADNIIADSPIGDRETYGGQLALGYQQDSFDAVLRASFQETKTGGLGYETLDPQLAAAGGVKPDPFDSVMATDIDTFDNIKSSDASLHLRWELPSGVALTSITAWHENDSPNLFDVDGSAVFLTSAGFARRDSETLSQELRVQSGNGPVDWAIGAIAFGESIDTRIELGYSDTNLLAQTPLCSPAFTPVLGACQNSVLETAFHKGDYFSAGVYGDASWQVSDSLSLGAGLRYSYDDKDFSYRADPVSSVVATLNATPLNPSGNLLGYSTSDWQDLGDDWDDWQPRLYGNWQFSDRASAFVNIARGFKAGGFEPAALPQLSVFAPEEVWNMDLGLRGESLRQRLRYQLTGFVYDYKDYQVQIIENGIARTSNLGGVDGRGLELETQLVLNEQLSFAFSAAWLDAKFKNSPTDTGNLKGNRPVLAPEYSAALTLNWQSPDYPWGGLGMNWLSAYQNEIFFTVQNTDDARQGSIFRHDARLYYSSPGGRWRLDVFARNIFNEQYRIFETDVGAGPVSRRGEPRFVGISVKLSL